jgi:hypothetical protein
MMRRVLSLLGVFPVLLNGCATWKAEPVAPATYIQSNHPEKIRLTLQDSTRLTLQTPTVVGDSIVGSVGHAVFKAVPVSSVRSFEVFHPNTGNSVGLVVGIVAGTFAVTAGIVAIWAAAQPYD